MARKFSQAKLDQFKKMFEEKRLAIITAIKKANTGEVDVEGDEVDVIQGAVISELSNQLSSRDLKTLEKIATAIEKIDSGDFGQCTECGHAIGEKRLLAIPGVEICIGCAEEQERTSKQYRS